MQAIKTVYNKTKFRSKLEARYAVLFDELGMSWEYEPESFLLKNCIVYCPDFYFSKLECYAEIKPNTVLNNLEQEKILNFEKPIVLICGLPMLNSWRLYDKPESIEDYYEVYPCRDMGNWRWLGCCDANDYPMEGNNYEDCAQIALFYDFFNFNRP